MSYTELEYGYQGLRKARPPQFYIGGGDLGLCDPTDTTLCSQEMDNGGHQVVVGVCAMAKKSQSKPMNEILTRLQEFEYIKVIVFSEETILKKPVEEWPVCDCLVSFHSKGFPLEKAVHYSQLHNPYVINNLDMQYDIQDRRKVYSTLESEGIEIPRYAVLDRDSPDPKHHELVESEDHVEVNGITFNKPFVEKPVSAEDHNIYIYYPTSAGGGSQRLFRKIGSRSSVYSPESRVRKTGSFIYEDFMPTDGTDVKVYTVGPDYAHAEARKSPALDGKVERDRDGKEIRYPVILSNAEKLISRKVCLAFKQAVCGFDLLRANGKSFVCDVNGFSFVKNSNKYYDDCAKILGNMILRELAPTLHIPWSVPFQLDDPPIVPTTFGKMMELRCVVAVIRHGDRTPKQKMKVEVRHPKFFEIFEKYDGYKHGHVKLKRPKQLQEILDIARSLLAEIQQHEADPEIEEKQGKLEQLKSVLEMYGHFSGINRKVQMKYQPKGRPRGSSSDDGKPNSSKKFDRPTEPSLVLILKWGGELTPAGRIQAEELGRIFRCMYPGGQGRHFGGEYAGAQGLGLLRLHSTFRHDLKIYASDEGRVQMTAAAFAKGLLALEGELTPILVQMVKSANTNGLLDNDCDSSKYQNMCKARLHELMQIDREFTAEDKEKINPGNSLSIADALDFVKNPFKCCNHVHELIKSLMEIIKQKKEDPKTKDAVLYHGETWELMGRRWGKIEKDFYTKNKNFDISKIPDIYDCIKYDLQHNQHTLQFEQAEELYVNAKYLADIVIPQEYGLTVQEKLTIGQGICTPLLKKIRADLQRNIEESGEEEPVNRLNPRYSHGVSSPGRHVRTRLYFTSESHVHSLVTVLRHGDLLDIKKDEQWRRAMEYISMVSELNYMSQVVVMLYEDPTKDPSSEERFHVELHFSPGVNCCVQKNLPPGPGFRPHSRNESVASKTSSNTSATATPDESKSNCSLRIDEEETEMHGDEEKIVPHTGDEQQTVIIHKTSPVTAFQDCDNNDDDNYYYYLSPPPTPEGGPRYKNYKSSDPIPIGVPGGVGGYRLNSHTVCGHEAMHLAKRLNEELAQQGEQSRGRRSMSPDPEPRSKSYDNKSAQTKGKADKLQYQSLDAVNSQAIARRSESPSDDNTDLSITPTNPTTSFDVVPSSSTTFTPSSLIDYAAFQPISSSSKQRPLSPISGSFDIDGRSESDSSPLTTATMTTETDERESPSSPPRQRKHSYLRPSPSTSSSRPASSTNELPLTELNLALFTSNCEESAHGGNSTNELPLCDVHFRHFLESNVRRRDDDGRKSPNDDGDDSVSLEVNWESENSENAETHDYGRRRKRTKGDDDGDEDRGERNNWPQHRSFSDPNILNTERDDRRDVALCPEDALSFHPIEPSKATDAIDSNNPLSPSSSTYARSPTNILSFFSSPSSITSTTEHDVATSSCAADIAIAAPCSSSTSSSTTTTPMLPSISRPKRSFSHPIPVITEPNVSDTDNGGATTMTTTTMTTRRHRHSIAGQMSYFKMLGGGGYAGFGPLLNFKKLTAGSANSLFSTAVISGSSSAPNLRDMIPSTASASAIEGFGGVPPIRPLETLHNALSLKQLDTFLLQMTVSPMFRTPSSTPPKYPSTPSMLPPSLPPSSSGGLPSTSTTGTNQTTPTTNAAQSSAGQQQPLRLQSPSNSWSGPPSFVSSGPSSPGLSDGYANSKESSDMSSSIISGDGITMGISRIFPKTPGLDQELENVGIFLETSNVDCGIEDDVVDGGGGGTIRFTNYFNTFHRNANAESEDATTPISFQPEANVNETTCNEKNDERANAEPDSACDDTKRDAGESFWDFSMDTESPKQSTFDCSRGCAKEKQYMHPLSRSSSNCVIDEETVLTTIKDDAALRKRSGDKLSLLGERIILNSTSRHKFHAQLSQPNERNEKRRDHRKTSLTNETVKSLRFTTTKVDETAVAACVTASTSSSSFSSSFRIGTDDDDDGEDEDDRPPSA